MSASIALLSSFLGAATQSSIIHVLCFCDREEGSSLVGSSTQRVVQLSAEIQRKRQQALAHHKCVVEGWMDGSMEG